ncbi:MAG: hypothetical protein QM677_08710 [Microbacterium sp.]
MKRSTILRSGAVAFGALVLASAGTATAFADATDYGSGDVDVNVDVTSTDTGTLALTVAADSTNLSEVTSSDVAYREFTGTLPEVTVTDTRSSDSIESGAYWYVLGSASDFTGTTDSSNTISSTYLGWSPSLVTDDGEATVTPGDDVSSVADDSSSTGLQDQELLSLTLDSAAAVDSDLAGVYTATAGLDLKIPATTTADTYTSVITLSLFEDIAG